MMKKKKDDDDDGKNGGSLVLVQFFYCNTHTKEITLLTIHYLLQFYYNTAIYNTLT